MDNIINYSMLTRTPPFLVRTSGMIRELPYHSTHGAKNGDIMLIVFLGGEGVFHSDQRVIKISAGMVGLILPDKAGLLTANPRYPYVHLYCRFSGGYAGHLARQIVGDGSFRFFECDKFQQVAEIMKKMGRVWHSELPLEMGRRELLLAEVLLLLGGSLEETDLRKISTSTLKYYLDEAISKPTDLQEMADYFGVSKATLCRQSKKSLGTTVQKYHEEVKIEWAKELLDFGLFQINEVARKLGYEDALYFARVFKKHTGVSPRAWLREKR